MGGTGHTVIYWRQFSVWNQSAAKLAIASIDGLKHLI